MEWLTRETANTAISMAGSASEAMVISRLEPMPPKAVPMSIPARAVKNRADGKEHDQGDDIGGCRQRQIDRDQMGMIPPAMTVTPKDEIGRKPEYPGGVLRQHHVLGESLPDVAVGLEQARRVRPWTQHFTIFTQPQKQGPGEEQDSELKYSMTNGWRHHLKNTSNTMIVTNE